jgi:hypothetical protein
MYEVSAFGERRADIRAAINTANLIAAQMIEPMTTEMFRNIVKALSSYMPGESDEDDEDDLFDPRAMAKLKEREQ